MPVVSAVISNILATRAYRQLKLELLRVGDQTEGASVTPVQFAFPTISVGTGGFEDARAVAIQVGLRSGDSEAEEGSFVVGGSKRQAEGRSIAT